MREDFLPVNRADMEKLHIEQLDFVYISGDAYVDHPSFGTAIISRLLQDHGYTVGIIPQPDYRDVESIAALGRPRLAFLVSAGNMDSMVNHYTVAKKHRKTDAYSPGGQMGRRPDRAVIVYCNLIRQVYKDVPVIAGGIEASLRRLAHYDYWSDSLRRSVLLESGADLDADGMGERSILPLAEALDAVRDGADCLGVGAMFSTSTKADADVLPPGTLRAICDAVDIPVVAIGGITKHNIAQLAGSGVDGVALVSAIFSAPDIESECRLLRRLSEEMVNA